MRLLDVYFETDRFILRPFVEGDIEPSYQMNLDPEVSKYTSDGGVTSRDEIKRRIYEDVFGDYKKHGYGRLAVVWKETNEFIGFAGLKYLEDLQEVDLGYRLMKDFWGRGIATEASKLCLNYGFEELGLDRIIAMIIPENKASRRVLDKLGFSFSREMLDEGILVHVFELNKWDYRVDQ